MRTHLTENDLSGMTANEITLLASFEGQHISTHLDWNIHMTYHDLTYSGTKEEITNRLTRIRKSVNAYSNLMREIEENIK